MAVALTGTWSDARGDLLEFRDGGRVAVPAEWKGDRIALQMPSRTYEFRRDDFRSIVRTAEPEQEWATRWGPARGDARAAFAAAWWAVEHGLTEEAARAIRVARSLEPGLQPAAGLAELLDHLAEPADDPDPARLRPWREAGYEEQGGPHLLLFHRHDPAEAGRRVAELESVLVAAYLMFGSLGLGPVPPRERLILVWFDDERAYESFVAAEAGSPQPGTSGYYSPARRMAATLDPRARPWYRRELAALPGADGERARRDRQRRELLLELRRETADLGTTAHELAHLIMAESGVARAGEQPLWLLEGLATQFEVVRAGRWAGFGRVNDSRLEDWRGASGRPSLARLLMDREFGHGYLAAPYAAAWSWVYFLRKTRPDLLVERLETRPASPGGGVPWAGGSPDELGLEREWLDFVDRLRIASEGPASAGSR